MNLKGTKTEQNLLTAFTGESVARNKYLFFADKARKEGHEPVAELFEQMAKNEGVHGRLLYQALKGTLGSSAENLQEAIQGEYGEWSSLYPGFAQTAREEGFDLVGTLFDEITKIEKDHERRFLEALAQLYGAPAAAAATPPAQAAEKPRRTVEVAGWRCQFCGATYESRPDVCGVCEAIGAFEPVTLQKPAD